MIDENVVSILGMFIGFVLGAVFMAWMGSEPAKALFKWKRLKLKDHGGGRYFGPVAFDPQTLIDRVTGADMRSSVPSCPICHGCGSVKSLSVPEGEIPCSCKLLKEANPDEADTVELTLEQSRAAAARARGEFPEDYVTINVEDIVRPKIKAKMEERGVLIMNVTAQIAANLTGKAFKIPEFKAKAKHYEEGEEIPYDEATGVYGEKPEVEIREYTPQPEDKVDEFRTFGPLVGRITSIESNFRTGDPKCQICFGAGILQTQSPGKMRGKGRGVSDDSPSAVVREDSGKNAVDVDPQSQGTGHASLSGDQESAPMDARTCVHSRHP